MGQPGYADVSPAVLEFRQRGSRHAETLSEVHLPEASLFAQVTDSRAEEDKELVSFLRGLRLFARVQVLPVLFWVTSPYR